jgi:hypothetical protein
MRMTKILVPALLLAMVVTGVVLTGRAPGSAYGTARAAGSVSHYDHIFVIVEENHNYNTIIGNRAAPTINQLAGTYGLATSYSGVADPSEPNYVAMIGGSSFGITSDDNYYTQTVSAASLVDQLEGAGLTWKGYFQSMPYPGYMGTCFPARCNGVPDADALYASKHNGFVNFTPIQQSATEQQKMVPVTQLVTDLASGQVPNFSFIVPDQCHDMHGAPPFCLDSGPTNSATDQGLVSDGDAYVGALVNEITGSAMWSQGQNAVVMTFDEGNKLADNVATVVITNHGPRGLKDSTSYNHFSLLLTVEDAFGLPCLQHSCDATVQPMAPLFAHP